MIIACRERGWFDARTDLMVWGNLCHSFDVPFQLVEHLQDIEWPPDHEVVVLDETGDTMLHDFVHPEKAVYVLGYSDLTGLQKQIPHQHAVRVDTPLDGNTFGISIAAIVLYDRLCKARF